MYEGWCLVQFGDAVDSQLEGRSGLEVGLVVVAVEDCLVGIGHEVAVGIGCKSRGNGFAANGELAGVEDMQAAVFQSNLDLSNLLGGTVSALGAKVGDGNSAILVALALGMAVYNRIRMKRNDAKNAANV